MSSSPGSGGAEDEVAHGRNLARFRLVRLLGRGGTGAVWLAHDPDLGRDVAIKVFAGITGFGDVRERFQREVRALASLNHPAVAQVYEAGDAEWPVEPGGQVSYLVME